MPRFYSDLTTREAVRTQLERAKLDGTDPTPVNSEDADFVDYVDSAIHSLSRFITDRADRAFVPYKEEKTWRQKTVRYSMWKLFDGDYGIALPEDFLVLSGVTWTDTLVSASVYFEYPENRLPYNAIIFDSSTKPLWSSNFADSIDIDAIWGYHTNLSEAWQTVETVTIASSSTTSITVADASIYETWQYLRCESEYLQITGRNTATNTLTVKRGVNGTTAASHISQALEKYVIIPDIQLAATRLVAWAYAHRNDRGNQIEVLPDGSVSLNTVPIFVQETLMMYKRLSFSTV